MREPEKERNDLLQGVFIGESRLRSAWRRIALEREFSSMADDEGGNARHQRSSVQKNEALAWREASAYDESLNSEYMHGLLEPFA